MSFKRRLLMLLVFTLAVALTGVNGVAQAQAVKNPDTLIIQSFGDRESLDPSWAYDTASSGTFLWNVYETLIFFVGGRTDLYEPMLATGVPSVANGGISADGKTYTFKIRPGGKFPDGKVMTPEDVRDSPMRFMLVDRGGGPAWVLAAAVLGVDHPSPP